MNTLNDTFSVTDLRHKTNAILKQAANQGIVYLLRHSKKEAAIIDIEYLKSLQEAYEDYLDILEFDRTIVQKRISLETHMKRHTRKK